MNPKLGVEIPLEPERYELRAAAPYRFDLDRREFFKFLGAGLVVFSVLKTAVVAQESGGNRGRDAGCAARGSIRATERRSLRHRQRPNRRNGWLLGRPPREYDWHT